jgi:hypothetical protein
VVEGLEKEIKSLRSEVIKLSWYMRGGITLEEAFSLSYEERTIIVDLIKDNMETTKKSGLPFF